MEFAVQNKKITVASTLIIAYSHTKGAFFWDYSGIGILGIDGISVLFGAIPLSK